MSDATDPAPIRAHAGEDAGDPLVYAVTLAPHRSLSAGGVLVVTGLTALASLGTGAVFLAMGAWPVTGFLGLDALLLYLAFRASARAARAREHITVTASLVEVRREPARGTGGIERLNPSWTRVERTDDDDFGTLEVALACGRRRVPVGGFLGPAEKGRLAGELAGALGAVRKGIVRSAP